MIRMSNINRTGAAPVRRNQLRAQEGRKKAQEAQQKPIVEKPAPKKSMFKRLITMFRRSA